MAVNPSIVTHGDDVGNEDLIAVGWLVRGQREWAWKMDGRRHNHKSMYAVLFVSPCTAYFVDHCFALTLDNDVVARAFEVVVAFH